MEIYFAGGMYYPTEKVNGSTVSLMSKPMSFCMVHAGNPELPHISHNQRGLSLCSQHSSLYVTDETLEKAYFVDNVHYFCGSGESPRTVILSDAHKKALQNSIDRGIWYD